MTKKLSPEVQKFKAFVQKHPYLIKEVREKKTTWQELFEEWYLLGEDDPKWQAYRIDTTGGHLRREKNKTMSVTEKNEWLQQLLESLKKLDPEQIQTIASQLSKALDIAIEFLKEMKTNEPERFPPPRSHHPFMFRKD